MLEKWKILLFFGLFAVVSGKPFYSRPVTLYSEKKWKANFISDPIQCSFIKVTKFFFFFFCH